MTRDHAPQSATCQCGQTKVTLEGRPILSAACLCNSCRTAALGFEHDLGAPRTVTAYGGVEYCSYRKDHVKVGQGGGNLKEYRLKPQSPTRRVVAMCCKSPMFADFTPGHWLSIYRDRLPATAPGPRMLLMTEDRPDGVSLPDGIPAYRKMPPFFLFKLVASWAAMGFRRPKITW